MDEDRRKQEEGWRRKLGEQAEKDSEVLEGIGQDGKQEGVRQAQEVVEVADVEVNEEEVDDRRRTTTR